MFDRNDALWGTSSDVGIYKIVSPSSSGEKSAEASASKVEGFREADGLTSNAVQNIFEDHEGNIWVATSAGLDRFRPVPVIREPRLVMVPQFGSSLLATSWGDVFFGQQDGVFRAAPGGSPLPISTNIGGAQALCQGLGRDVWIVTQKTIVRFNGRIRNAVDRPAEPFFDDCVVNHQGALFLSAGAELYELTVKGWRVLSNEQDSDGGGAVPLLVRKDGKLLTSASSQSIRLYDPPSYTNILLHRPNALLRLSTISDEGDAILLGGRFGVARWRGSRFEFVTSQRVPALRGTFGIVRTPEGETWMMTSVGIVRMASDDLNRAFADPRWGPSTTVFGTHEGLPGVAHAYGLREAARGGDGRLWFATNTGTAWVDPVKLKRDPRPSPPPVSINAVTLGNKIFRDPSRATVTPVMTKVIIAFSAISLGNPDAVHVRYKLEGADKEWNEAGSLRQVSYNDLRPGHYQFHVIAADEDGVWNKSGAVLDLTVEPTFFQSPLFMSLCAIVAAVLLWAAYTVRARQLTARVREHLETRHAERERIARELHDTLLQGFQGLVLRFQSVANRMAPNSDLRPPLELALQQAENVLTEGRNRVSNLRASEVNADLASDIATLIAGLGADPLIPLTVTVEGRVRPLEPIVREEMLRISEEAVRNALSHANPSKIEVGLIYSRELRLGIRDDGSGLPNDVASAGQRPGHFGLIGMRERAERAGGKLAISSSPALGTEIRVTVPGRLAYTRGRTVRRKPFLIPRT
ncbi:hypothetical protein KZX46_00355 (plasmid) [Polymorphobacter sp. PAMC 29334]|uniref:sensor histidine kinase n=1 Tax=Polymorphobacter sp. PAMC 29334 TaxID=2862331 RepID=UPI001C7565DA|nr:sensor histidine kinase [Polymorphobacter sp. PAMC 29334]QYE33296.1 hypothetical protein KZX46_00355 [Polymorphobacter sp. PAMC 29334]